MKKYVIFVGLFIMLVLTGCNQQTNTVERKADSNENSINSEKTEKGTEEVEENVESSINVFDFPLKIDPQLEEKLHLAENGENSICLSIEDTTVLNSNVVLGCIEQISPEAMDSFEGGGLHSLVYYDVHNGSVLGYMPVGENPYVGHRDENETLTEEQVYKTAYYELERSLINSGFHHWYIQPNQELPEQLDSNQLVGIDISENMLQDILEWYTPLKEAIDNEVDSHEWFQLVDKAAEKSYQKYPEIRQIPFPTFEIGYNITKTIFEFQSLGDRLDDDVHFEKLRSENIVLSIGNSIMHVEKQLEELKATYQ